MKHTRRFTQTAEVHRNDKLFTELKSTQNSLEMAITHPKQKYYGHESQMPVHGNDFEVRNLPKLTDEETREISKSIMDDFEENLVTMFNFYHDVSIAESNSTKINVMKTMLTLACLYITIF